MPDIQAQPNEQQVTPNEQQVTPNEQQVTPEAQEQFDMFVANGIEIIHDEKVSEGFLGRIMKSERPVQTIAEITVDVVNRLYDSAEEANMKLTPDTLVHGSNILMGEVITIAETAGMQPLTDEQKTESYQLAVSKYIDDAVKSGRLSQQELAQLGQQIGQTPEGQKIAQQMQAGPQGQPQSQGQPQPQQQVQQQPQPQEQGILAGGA